jgi:hypothetical protein
VRLSSDISATSLAGVCGFGSDLASVLRTIFRRR